MNIYGNNISKSDIAKLKSRFIKILNRIVWYIPIMKLRDYIRNNLSKKLFDIN